jgi:hypothetical protein
MCDITGNRCVIELNNLWHFEEESEHVYKEFMKYTRILVARDLQLQLLPSAEPAVCIMETKL